MIIFIWSLLVIPFWAYANYYFSISTWVDQGGPSILILGFNVAVPAGPFIFLQGRPRFLARALNYARPAHPIFFVEHT